MDFALLPPEINSGRMYAGPGSGPMLAAAAAWDELATGLQSTAASYGSTIETLTVGSWKGPSSISMAAAAAPYVAWLGTAALQAEQTAIQAKAAATAYEAAFAATVPPPVIAANRTLLQALAATNLFGQNTAAIAATEAHYAEMWAQDATAMYGYAGASASATTLPRFAPAPQTTAGASVATSTQTEGSAIGVCITAIGEMAQNALDALSADAGLTMFLPGVAQAGLTPLSTTGIFVNMQYDATAETLKGMDGNIKRLAALAFGGPVQARPVSAALSQASTVGRLSVPNAWTVAAPEIRLAAMTLPATSLGAPPEVLGGSPGSLFSQMALASMAGRAITGPVSPGIRERVSATTRACPAPSLTSPGSPTAEIAEMREVAELLGKLGSLRDSGILTEAEFSEQKQRLISH